jgi:hypothetical protein
MAAEFGNTLLQLQAKLPSRSDVQASHGCQNNDGHAILGRVRFLVDMNHQYLFQTS